MIRFRYIRTYYKAKPLLNISPFDRSTIWLYCVHIRVVVFIFYITFFVFFLCASFRFMHDEFFSVRQKTHVKRVPLSTGYERRFWRKHTADNKRKSKATRHTHATLSNNRNSI